ncbi:MAG: aminopeptidase P N-terminal domain-containing protein [Nitrospinae bacterium]|nr:aminopeptidase P N-terminal domain-containing protein [Nitrospinota bacterium]
MSNQKKTYSGIFRDGGAGKFAKRRYRERRRKLMKRENKLMAITGVPYGPGQETVWAYAHCPTYQEPAIMYLTGVNQSAVILLLDPGSKESDEILFVEEKDPSREFWDGVRFGVGDSASVREVRRITGIKDVRDILDFEKVLKARFKKRRSKKLGTLWMQGVRNGKIREIKIDHNGKFKTRLTRWLRSWNGSASALCNIMENHFELRLPLDSYDVANTLAAQKITGRSFRETLRSFYQLKSECQVQGFLEGGMLQESPYGLSFPSIIASGHNATVLHYMKNDDPIDRNELVLMDFGVRWMTMHADISRTVPASGKFNPMQKMLYEIVLRAQLAVQRKSKQGVTIDDLNECCWGSINRGLEQVFQKAGGKFKLEYKKRPHGVSHLIGEQEHDGDPFRNYSSQPMKAGWLISNEPGLYGEFHIRLNGRVYEEQIGIRLEDNLLITRTGCRNLSQSIPKTVEQIERLMLRREK